MSGYNRGRRMGSYLGDEANRAAMDAAQADNEAEAAARLKELYRVQAAAAAGAGRAAEAASNAASDAGRVAEAAQAVVMENAAADAAGRIYTRPNYLRIGLVFGGLGLGAYLLMRRKPHYGGHR